MTSEQIAELRSRESYGDRVGIDRDDLRRLLDEREALLTAAKFIVENWDVFDGHEADISKHHATLVKAIAKAEAP